MCAVITLSNVPYPPRNSSRSLGGPSMPASRSSIRTSAVGTRRRADRIRLWIGETQPSLESIATIPPADERLLAFVLWG
jgi:hypothetical protein